jgi:hypothetical protein
MITEGQAMLFIAVGIVAVFCWRIIQWIFSGRRSADPWDEVVEAAIQDVPPLCHKCLVPQEQHGWFCWNCGASNGPYNNYLPFVFVFSVGEVLRSGTCEPVRRKPSFILFYFLVALATNAVFAPLYWFAFLLNLGKPAKPTLPPEPQ